VRRANVLRATCYVLSIVTVACGVKADGPPQIVVDRTPCAHCGMLVSEPAFAAAYRRDGTDARIFDDIGCLLNAMKGEANPERLRFWFHDADSAEWIDSSEAVFVRSARLRTPMSSGIVAYRGEAAAGRVAVDGQATIVGNFDQLITSHTQR
jgi:copper chaperone NosL